MSKDPYKTLCANLNALRKKHELTQEQLSELVGMHFKHYQRIEQGHKKQMWLSSVDRLAKVFGLEAWQMIYSEVPEDSKLKRKSPPRRKSRGKG